ncbi:MAG TPA: Hsp20/alpha crystallin family protein [Myxococcota bacterium]|nr:Hsp20/alpha crystallin family protein [Myxococcota bacterium]HQK49708.1 Hsp20/alpha crystallin family protein [Myxococcota bacterium]
MSIQRWDPFREFERLHEEVDRLFRNVTPSGAVAGSQCWVPVDVLENAEEVVLRAELPGVKPDQVDVRIEDNVLTLSGEKKLENEEKKDQYLRVERFYGKFSRAFTLPHYVDAGKVVAEYKDGVLTLHLPKKAETKPRQIPVKAG